METFTFPSPPHVSVSRGWASSWSFSPPWEPPLPAYSSVTAGTVVGGAGLSHPRPRQLLESPRAQTLEPGVLSVMSGFDMS